MGYKEPGRNYLKLKSLIREWTFVNLSMFLLFGVKLTFL